MAIKIWKLDIILGLVLILLVLVFLNRGARMEGVFFGADEVASDLLHFSYPYREYFATDFLKKGKIPLWNPYLASGMPILAEAQTGVFYPPAILLYYFLPAPVAFNWLVISSFMIISIGTYLYAREMGLQPLFAFFSATVFTFSGFMIGHLRHVPVVTAIAFMPSMFVLVEKMIKSYRLKYFVILSTLLAFSFLAGHLTSTYTIIFILIVYFLIRISFKFHEQNKESLTPILLFFGAIVLGIGLAAVQLLPSLELIKYSTRATPNLTRLFSPGYSLEFLWFFVSPYFLGDPSRGVWHGAPANYWENIGYVGILPLFLAFAAIFFGWKKNEQISSLALLLVLSFVLVLGDMTVIYRVLFEAIPGFSFARISARFLLFVDFFLAVLAGFGLYLLYQRFPFFKRKTILFLLLGISFGDLFYFGYGFNNVMPLSYLEEPKSVKFLKQDHDLFRIHAVDFSQASWNKVLQESRGWRGDLAGYIAQRENLPPDLNLLYRLSSPTLIYALVGHYSVRRPGELDSLTMQTFNQKGRRRTAKFLGSENVKYLVSSDKLDETPGLELVKVIESKNHNFTTYIYKNREFLPRAYLVGRALYFKNENEVFDKMTSDDFNPKHQVFLENAPYHQKTKGIGKVTISYYSDTKVILDVDSDEGGYVVFSDTYYPGWEVTIDGHKDQIFLANLAYRAVYVEGGHHRLVFSFVPKSFIAGGVVSTVSFLFLLGSSTAFLRKRRREQGL